jgi:hypothetical protein
MRRHQVTVRRGDAIFAGMVVGVAGGGGGWGLIGAVAGLLLGALIGWVCVKT